MNLKAFYQNFQFDAAVPPPPPYPIIRHKRVLLLHPAAKFDKTY